MSGGRGVYRAPMRARNRDLPEGAGADHGLEHGLVGTGDALTEAPATLEEAIVAASAAHGGKAGRNLARFAEAAEGSFVWTRDSGGAYRLGRISGPWRYDASAAAAAVGIHHVRSADWLERSFGEDEVPPAVAATFARGGKNFQRTRDEEAERRSPELWKG